MDTTDNPFPAPIAEYIWDLKYRLKDNAGQPIDATVQDTWMRIAKALASVEGEQAPVFEAEFYEALSDFKFTPAGRIVAGAGTGRAVTLFNCFVMGTIPDSMDGIFAMLREAALTMQQGGGIGYDFSPIRPKGALVKKLGADASGPLTFMDVWDAMCRTVMSAGSRRGAMMATMRCDHPDIMDYITAKSDPARLRMFNLSVLVTDDFMKAVRNESVWELCHSEPPKDLSDTAERTGLDGKKRYVYETVNAKDLWDAILRNTYNQAEPGVIFIDRINTANNLNYLETIASTNPCGEQPLPPYGACLLGSINLVKFIENAFLVNAGLDSHELKKTVQTAVRMMDNVIDVSNFPVPQQQEEAKNKRRIGLGVTGLADALIMCGLTYGSDEAARRVESWMQIIDEAAYLASCDLAKEKGAFPLFNAEKFLSDRHHVAKMSDKVQGRILAHGIRNGLLTSIAPTGTISLYAGNVSSGIEPVFALAYDRKVLQPDGSRITETVEDYAVAAYREFWETEIVEWLDDPDNGRAAPAELFDPDKHLPDYFVTAQTLAPADHVRMQAAAQLWVDSSISKTINCPEDISFEDFALVYDMAYDSGCKGCTTYRPNEVTGSVLSITEKPKAEEVTHAADVSVGEAVAAVYGMTDEVPMKRPSILPGQTYKIKFGDDEHAIYVTLTDLVEGGSRRPFEIFINSKNMEHFAWTVALTRMISAVFRRPHDSRFVVEELKAVFDPKGGAWMEGKYVPSVLAAIGGVIENHMKSIGYMEGDASLAEVLDDEIPTFETTRETPKGASCQKCSSFNLKHENGCLQCLDCGHSKCG